ncbi:polysaccharide pyruvyl transferase family protein [Halomonas sp. TP35]
MLSRVKRSIAGKHESTNQVPIKEKIEASLLVYGPCSNAGDVLIHKAIEKLFEGEINFKYHHIRADKLDNVQDNILVGPGGILSGSYTPEKHPDEWLIRHLTSKRVQDWKEKGKNLAFFGTGTNTPLGAKKNQKPFSRVSEGIIADLFAISSGVYVRGNYDRQRLQTMCASKDAEKLIFQPCPSIFIDSMAKSAKKKTNKVAVNFPFMNGLTAENYKKHPIRRFVSYARSCGLECEFSPNHTQDINEYVFDIFDYVDVSEELKSFIFSSLFKDKTTSSARIQEEWESIDCIFSRFSGYRFAFGARLHSFLPFMAYETPSLFLTGNDVRKPMPTDYFNNPIYLAPHSYNPTAMDAVVDGMIDRLSYFIKYEDKLICNIRESKERLWDVTKANKAQLLSSFQ